jgi:GDP-L-fucose synthase
MTEDALLTGPLEPTNDAYDLARISRSLHVQAVRRRCGLSWISIAAIDGAALAFPAPS